MKYRTLGKTGLKVSVIGVGTWQYGGEWGKTFTQAEVNGIIGSAADLGMNLIDTAECYGDHVSEKFIGTAIQGKREKWIVATKFGHEFHGFLKRSDKRSAADVAGQVELSLKALRTDYIDLYQYHSVRDSEFDNQELCDLLLRLVKAGKVRHIGNSISSGIHLKHQVSRSPWANVGALQLVYNRLERKAEEVLNMCRELHLGVMARVPLASGLLSGKYRPGASFGQGDVRAGRKAEELQAQLREVEQIARNEVPKGIDMAQWALAWCLKDPVVTCVIPGCKSIQQVQANAAAADLVQA